MPDLADALFDDPHGTQIAIEVTAGAKAAAFPAGYNEWRNTIGCRVTSPALEGRANKAVMTLIARKLKVPASSVRIQSGAASSQKKVLVTGMSREEILSCLQQEK
jgi:uncharacterized protein